jgi:hypothetical protein
MSLLYATNVFFATRQALRTTLKPCTAKITITFLILKSNRKSLEHYRYPFLHQLQP